MPKKPKTTPPTPSDLTGHEPRLSKFQGFRPGRVHRSQVRNAPYNPRTISKASAAALREELRANLLVEPLVWNERTGNLVGGHQRLAQLDALEGSPDYSLDFAIIDVDERKERSINVALNNPRLQGAYDFEKLNELLSAESFDFASAGLDQMTVATWFGAEAPIANNPFSTASAPAPVRDVLGELGALQEQERPKREKKADETEDERVTRMKREKKDYREAAADRDDTEYITVIVWPDRARREQFMKLMGLDADERYLSGKDLAREMGLHDELFKA